MINKTICVVFLGMGFAVGVMWGDVAADRRWQKDMIKKGYAHYIISDKTNGISSFEFIPMTNK